jgi:hypothetical protein
MLPAAGEGREGALRSQRIRRLGRRRVSLWLAVGLLLLQAAVTAGHFHPEDFSILAGSAPAALTVGLGPSGTPLPGGQPALPVHDDCSLCFSLHLGGESALPAPLLLTVPQQQGSAVHPSLVAWRLAPAPYLLFRTRAPPIA